jgi:hypothetical protein
MDVAFILLQLAPIHGTDKILFADARRQDAVLENRLSDYSS